MIIKKKVQGKIIPLEMETIKKYPRYTRYQIYKRENGKRIPLYTTCYTDLQLVELAKRNFFIDEEDNNVCN